jgi:uncharacterized membrane protein YbhN (UPF0104 family)
MAGSGEKSRWVVTKRLVSWLFALLALGGSLYLAHRGGLRWSVLWEVKFLDLLLLVTIGVGSVGVNGMVNLCLLRALGADVDCREAFGLSAAGTWLNMILPLQGGAAGRALYLKRRHGVAYSHFVAVQGATYTLFFLIGGLAGMGLWLLLSSRGMDLSPLLLYLCVALTGGMGLLLIMPLPKWAPQNRFARMLASAMEGWQVLKRPRVAAKVGGLLTLNFLLAALRLGVAFSALGQNVSPSGILFVAVLVSLSQVVRLTPGNLGIREGVTGAMAEVVGSGFGAGVLASGLIRVVTLLVAVALGPLASSWLGRQLVENDRAEPISLRQEAAEAGREGQKG